MNETHTISVTCDGIGSNAQGALQNGRRNVRAFFDPVPTMNSLGEDLLNWEYGKAQVRERALNGDVIQWEIPVTGTYNFFPTKATNA